MGTGLFGAFKVRFPIKDTSRRMTTGISRTSLMVALIRWKDQTDLAVRRETLTHKDICRGNAALRLYLRP